MIEIDRGSQERIAIGIVVLTFLCVCLRYFARSILDFLSVWLLKRGRVKWAFFVRKQRSHFSKFFSILTALFVILNPIACTSLPTPEHKKYIFPKGQAYIEEVKRPHFSLGYVRSKINYQTLDPNSDEDDLCRNYFNQSVKQLVQFAKEKGGDAVAHVRSIVFYRDGTHKLYTTPECSDDGMEGQILTQGEVIQWKDSLYSAPN